MKKTVPLYGLIICFVLGIFLVGWVTWDYLLPEESTTDNTIPKLQYWDFILEAGQTKNSTFYVLDGISYRLEMSSSEAVHFRLFGGNPHDPPFLNNQSDLDFFAAEIQIVFSFGVGEDSRYSGSLLDVTWLVDNPSTLSVESTIRITLIE